MESTGQASAWEWEAAPLVSEPLVSEPPSNLTVPPNVLFLYLGHDLMEATLIKITSGMRHE